MYRHGLIRVVVGLMGLLPLQLWAQNGGHLDYPELQGIPGLNPYQLIDQRGPTDRLFSIIYEPLLRYDHNKDAYVPVLAESLPQISGNVITFKLRRGVRWHDEAPFTSADVRFTYEYIERVYTPKRALYERLIVSMSTPDPHTFRVTLSEAVSEPEAYFTEWILPSHWFQGYLSKKNEGKDLEVKANGTGPYKHDRTTLRGAVHLSRWDMYWGTPGRIATVSMLRETDVNTMVQKANFTDAMRLLVETPWKNLSGPPLAGNPEWEFKSYNSFAIHAFGYNYQNTILQDRRVRQALTYAVNRTQLLVDWYGERGTTIGGPFTPQSPFYNPAVKPLRFSPEQAKRLLDQADYVDRNNDGIRESPSGQRLSFDLINLKAEAAGATERQNVAKSYIDYLRQIGVEVRVQDLDRDSYLIALRNSDFDIVWVLWEFDPRYEISALFDEDGSRNIIHFYNNEVQKLLDLVKETSDSEYRRALLYQVQEILMEECPYTFLYTIDHYAAIHNSLYNVEIEPYYFFTYLPKWFIVE